MVHESTLRAVTGRLELGDVFILGPDLKTL